MAPMYSRWRHNKRRARSVAIGATIGSIVAGIACYAIGFLVLPIFQSNNEILRDPYACGATGGFLGLVVGFVVGARLGEYSYRKARGAEFRAARKEQFPVTAFGHAVPERGELEEDPPQWRSKSASKKRKPRPGKNTESPYP